MAAYAPLGGLPQAQAELQNANTNTQNASTNAMAEYTRAAQEKAQTALLGQQTQAAAQQNQATQAVNQAYQGAFKKDPTTGQMTLDTDGLQQELAQNGHGAAIPAVIKGITDYQASKADLQKKQADLQTSGADAMGNLGYAMQQANYDPRLADTIILDHLNDPSLTPQMRQSLLQERQQIQQNPALVKQIADQWVLQSPKQQQNAIDRTKAEAEKTKAGASQQTADQGNIVPLPELGVSFNKSTGETQPIAGAAMSPQMRDAKALAIQQKMDSGHQLDPGDQTWLRAYKQIKTVGQQFNLNAQQSGGGLIPGQGQTGGQGGPPPTVDAVPNSIKGTVQQILDYRAQLPPAGRNNPTNTAIRYWVNALDPQHDDSTFPARNKLMTAFTSGTESHQINSTNTAIGHIGVLGGAIDALNNGDVKGLNKIANGLGAQVGATPQTTFQTIVHRVGPELAAAYIQGGGGEGERGTTAADFDPSLSPAQLKANVGITAQLLRSKIGSLENQYKQTMGRDDFQQRFITPEAQSTLDKWSPQGSGRTGGVGTPPAGATHTAKGSDGKLHYTNAQGQDLGIAQ